MDMESKKEHWVERTLNSLNGISRAVPSAEFQARVLHRIQGGRSMIESVRPAMIYKAAAAILIIISVNVMSCIIFQKSLNQKKEMTSLSKEFCIEQSGESILDL